jgi:drug/metabolite transporter (DMT)-like permease
VADGRATWIGIGFGLCAGALWGLVFLAPELARGFTPLQFAAGRYLAYGLMAALLIAPRWRALTSQLRRRDWLTLGHLSLSGNIVYYLFLAAAVQLAGIAAASIIIGFLPVVVSLVGLREPGGAPLRRLAPSLVLGFAGVVCIGWSTLTGSLDETRPNAVLGLLCATGALACWTAYAVYNSRALRRLPHISAHNWNLLTGVVTGAFALVLTPFAVVAGAESQPAGEWLRFALIVTGLAFFASILGAACWNQMSRLLPLSLAGQMILFETLFALLYGFLWEQRAPTWVELAAISLMLGSVLSCLHAHQPREGRHA